MLLLLLLLLLSLLLPADPQGLQRAHPNRTYTITTNKPTTARQITTNQQQNSKEATKPGS